MASVYVDKENCNPQKPVSFVKTPRKPLVSVPISPVVRTPFADIDVDNDEETEVVVQTRKRRTRSEQDNATPATTRQHKLRRGAVAPTNETPLRRPPLAPSATPSKTHPSTPAPAVIASLPSSISRRRVRPVVRMRMGGGAARCIDGKSEEEKKKEELKEEQEAQQRLKELQEEKKRKEQEAALQARKEAIERMKREAEELKRREEEKRQEERREEEMRKQKEEEERRMREEEMRRKEEEESKKKRGGKIIELDGQQYTLTRKIGKGGSAEVYEVLDRSGKAWALKVVVDKRLFDSCKKEIEIIQQLGECPHTVFLRAFHVSNSKILMLMELGSGDLHQELKTMEKVQGHLYANEAVKSLYVRTRFKQMLIAVGEVHKKDNIVHADLKPANFLFVGAELKLIDFGIANTPGEETVNIYTDTVAGTLNYMSPEALQQKYGKPRDVWSLAIILYQLIYKRPPFYDIAEMTSKLAAIAGTEKRPIKMPNMSGWDNTNSELAKSVMSRCLQFDPKKRPTIAELLDDPFLKDPMPLEHYREVAMGMNKDDRAMLWLLIQQYLSI